MDPNEAPRSPRHYPDTVLKHVFATGAKWLIQIYIAPGIPEFYIKTRGVMEQDLAGKLKCLNRVLLRNRILSLKINKEEQECLRHSIGDDDMFNLKVALHSCDTFEQLYEFIEIL